MNHCLISCMTNRNHKRKHDYQHYVHAYPEISCSFINTCAESARYQEKFWELETFFLEMRLTADKNAFKKFLPTGSEPQLLGTADSYTVRDVYHNFTIGHSDKNFLGRRREDAPSRSLGRRYWTDTRQIIIFIKTYCNSLTLFSRLPTERMATPWGWSLQSGWESLSMKLKAGSAQDPVDRAAVTARASLIEVLRAADYADITGLNGRSINIADAFTTCS